MNRTDLIATVKDYLNRTDLPDNTVGRWFDVVDGEVNRELVDHPRMVKRATLLAVLGATTIPVPLNLLQMVNLRVGETPLVQFSPGARVQAAATPGAYIVNGACIDLFPPCTEDTAFVMDYAAAIDPLTADNLQNWVSAYAPDVYLYGALREAAIYLKDDARLAVWDGLFRQYLDRTSRSGWGANYSTAPVVRVGYV